jgi:hypothetical protein
LNVTLGDIDLLKNRFAALDNFYADCRDKFKTVVEQKPDGKYEQLSVKEIFQLLENRIQYRDSLVKTATEKELDRIIGGLTAINEKILNNNIITDDDIDYYNAQDFLANYPSIEQIKLFCKWINAPEPADKISTIASFQKEHKASVNKVKNRLKFKKSDYSYNTKAMKKIAEKNAGKRNMKLLHIGMESDNWTVVKNGLGIPLYKMQNGRGLYHVGGENFYRGYDVRIEKQYNGNGYDQVSVVKAGYTITIYKK